MHPWQAKAVKDALKASLPFQGVLRRAKRMLAHHATNPENDVHMLGDILRQIAALRNHGFNIRGKTILEIGPGWKPILPLIYLLCGANRIVLVDQERLIDSRQIHDAAKFLDKALLPTAERFGVDLGELSLLPPPFLSLTEFFRRAGIEYLAPFDFMKLPHNSADLVVSRDALEHIPEKKLREIMKHSRSVLRLGGLLCHTIDMSDHWQHSDHSISKVNFLRYEGIWWALAGTNPQNYQNRLRRYEYLNIIQEAGFDIIYQSGQPDLDSITSLQCMPICKRYRDTPHKELAVLATTIIARRA